MNKKVQKLLEELGVEAAKPVATTHGEGKPLKLSLSNSKIYSADKHQQAEEVEGLVIESYTRQDLQKLFEALNLDTDKYTFGYLAEELGFKATKFLNESTGKTIVLYEAKGDLMTRARIIATKTGLSLATILAIIGGGRWTGDNIQFNQANQAYTQQVADATRDKSNAYWDSGEDLFSDRSPINVVHPNDKDNDVSLTDEDFAAIETFKKEYKELYGKEPSMSEIIRGTGLEDKYESDPRWTFDVKYKDEYTTAFPELVKSGFFKPELKKTGTEEGNRSSAMSLFNTELQDAEQEIDDTGGSKDSIDKVVDVVTRGMSQKYMSQDAADKAYSDAESSYEAKGGARDIGTGIGAGISALGLGAAALADRKKRPDIAGMEPMAESYTRKDLQELFESLNLDTHKYTFGYLAEQLGFEAVKPNILESLRRR